MLGSSVKISMGYESSNAYGPKRAKVYLKMEIQPVSENTILLSILDDRWSLRELTDVHWNNMIHEYDTRK